MAYSDVTIPEDTPPEEYSYVQRRAELFQFVLEAGDPRVLSRTKFAENYDVHKSTITRDLQAIEDEIAASLGDDALVLTEVIFRRAFRKLNEDHEYTDAVDTALKYNDWLMEIGAIDRAADKHEHEVNAADELAENLRRANEAFDPLGSAIDSEPPTDGPTDE